MKCYAVAACKWERVSRGLTSHRKVCACWTCHINKVPLKAKGASQQSHIYWGSWAQNIVARYYTTHCTCEKNQNKFSPIFLPPFYFLVLFQCILYASALRKNSFFIWKNHVTEIMYVCMYVCVEEREKKRDRSCQSVSKRKQLLRYLSVGEQHIQVVSVMI